MPSMLGSWLHVLLQVTFCEVTFFKGTTLTIQLLAPSRGALTLRQAQTDHVTFRPSWSFYKTFRPLWQFTTVTLQPCGNFLLWHSDPKWTGCSSTNKWMDCHSVTLPPTVILANPWLWHFVLFLFWFLLHFLPLKRLLLEIAGIWRDWSTRFSDPCRAVA
jgi:hypothetical protein